MRAMLTRRMILAGTALTALLLATGQGPAAAAPRTPERAAFERAVVACEQRTTPAGLSACVRDLVAPDPAQPEVYDLWRIFLDCLSYADRAMLDTMYPPTEEDYEDAVNDCLGL